MIEEFNLSGEAMLMSRLCGAGIELKTIFDVGANCGEWAHLAINTNPDAAVHSFEPIPSTYRKLIRSVKPNMVINPFGLSDSTKWAMFKYTADNDKLTTQCLELQRDNEEYISALLIDGLSYCTSHRIGSVDFLKVDTEGHEYEVVKGFGSLLEDGGISIIQFEYGYANILTKNLLIDFYRLLEPIGYRIGKLSRNGVDFKGYNLLDEDFKGPNYVAVLGDRTDIIEAISE